MKNLKKIGLGGGCHWCTEAVFQTLKGVQKVEQGYISSTGAATSFSEAVIVHFDPDIISLEDLIKIHLYTHRSTSKHSLREKYRSAVYFFETVQAETSKNLIEKLQEEFRDKIITQILPFQKFRSSRDSFLDYYKKNPEKPFCRKYIHPKLKLLQEKFSGKTRVISVG